MNLFLSRCGCVAVLFLAVGALRAAEDAPLPTGSIQVTLLGEVLKKGRVQLRRPATIEDAFVAAGGYHREEGPAAPQGRPADYCVLLTSDHGIDMNMEVKISVDRKSRAIRVIDEGKRALLLKNGDTVIFPVVVR